MKLVITTPTAVAVSVENIVSLRAEDDSGWFGVLPGHANFLTALAVSVVSWREAENGPRQTAGDVLPSQPERYCAVRGGVLTVRGGETIAIATREAVAGDDLARLEDEVLQRFRSEADVEASARIGAARLHVAALQRLMGYLRPAPQETGAGHLRTARNHGGGG